MCTRGCLFAFNFGGDGYRALKDSRWSEAVPTYLAAPVQARWATVSSKALKGEWVPGLAPGEGLWDRITADNAAMTSERKQDLLSWTQREQAGHYGFQSWKQLPKVKAMCSLCLLRSKRFGAGPEKKQASKYEAVAVTKVREHSIFVQACSHRRHIIITLVTP